MCCGEKEGTATRQRPGRGSPASPPVLGLELAVFPGVRAHGMAVWRLLPSPGPRRGAGCSHPCGTRWGWGTPWSSTTAATEPCPAQAVSLHLLPRGGWLRVRCRPGSGTAGRNLVCGCRRPSERHGVACGVPAREEGCCPARGEGSVGLERRRDAGAFSLRPGPSRCFAPALGSDGVSLSLHISPSLLRIPGCV